MPISADDFKRALASWPSGVTIVTTCVDEAFQGMTVSDFAGVSMDPPLVLVCASKSSNTLEWIQKGRCFAVNILAEDQQALSNRFATQGNEDERFDGIETQTAKTGAPLLPGTLAGLDCSLVAEHDAGDHVLLVGQVEHLVVRDLPPLLYFRGGYRNLSDDG